MGRNFQIWIQSPCIPWNFKSEPEIKHHSPFCWWSILNSYFNLTLVLSCSRHYKAINNLNTVKMLQLDPAAELRCCSLLEFIICWQKFGLQGNSYIYPGEGKTPAYNFTLAQYCRVSKLCNYALCDLSGCITYWKQDTGKTGQMKTHNMLLWWWRWIYS